MTNVRQVVTTALKEIQELSGRDWVPLSGNSRPISVLPGFDSQNGIEVTCLLEKLLQRHFPLDENLCVEDLGGGKRRARTLNEVVDRVEELLGVKA
jgi:hypothetical protein